MQPLTFEEANENARAFLNFLRNFSGSYKPHIHKDYYTKVLMSAGAAVFILCFMVGHYAGSMKHSDNKAFAYWLMFIGAVIFIIMYIAAMAMHHEAKSKIRSKYYALRMDDAFDIIAPNHTLMTFLKAWHL